MRYWDYSGVSRIVDIICRDLMLLVGYGFGILIFKIVCIRMGIFF